MAMEKKHSLQAKLLRTFLIERKKNSILLASDLPFQVYNFNNESVLENIVSFTTSRLYE